MNLFLTRLLMSASSGAPIGSEGMPIRLSDSNSDILVPLAIGAIVVSLCVAAIALVLRIINRKK